MKNGRHIIWSNDIDYDDWREDLEEQYPDLTETERMELMYEMNGDYLDDKRSNLDIQLSRPILVVGDLGLWHGRRMGYKEIPSGNIRDCLYSERDMDYSTWYVDKNGDFRCDAIHHDGTNHYLYRAYKDSVSDTQKNSTAAPPPVRILQGSPADSATRSPVFTAFSSPADRHRCRRDNGGNYDEYI